MMMGPTMAAQSVVWWQMALILLGASFWDLGWHGIVHHPNAWFAKPVVRVIGLALPLASFIPNIV